MTLTRLVLHNYMIHRDMTADFNGNLIALTGEMGHGKSTFVGAIQFCLTGEHPPWHREDLLTWGETEGSAKLYFIQDGIDCSILRKLHSPEVVLTLDHERETFTGARNVEKILTSRLGVDKDILKQIGFVQQYEIQSILFDDPGKRERSFQKLLGIGDANKIWTDLGPIIQSYSKSENFDASIESLRQAVARLGKELEGASGSIAAAKKALSLLPSRSDMSAELERLTKLQTHLTYIQESRDASKKLDDKITRLTSERTSLVAKREGILSKLGCSLEEMDKFVKTLKSTYDADFAAYNNMKKLAGTSDVNGICPLCGSYVKEGQIAGNVSGEIERLEKNAKKSKDDFDSTTFAYLSVTNEVNRIESTIAAADSNLKLAASALDTEKEREKRLLSDFAQLGIAPENSDSSKLKETIDADARRLKDTLLQYDELSSQIATVQGEINAKNQQLEQTNELLDAKVKEKELSAPMAKKIEILTNVRNWFHSSNGPRTISLGAIKAMTGYVNEYLNALHSEIEVMPDNNGLSFAFDYLDGRQVSDPPPSTAKLSGGQKIELALAFRLAIYRYFGQKMGIMVLDEPTAHLSPAGIEYFGGLLQTVSTLAKNMNLQIIMPTHEKEIMPYMDSEIHFS